MNDAAQPSGTPDVSPARPRIGLSEVRTQLALDRTTLAWIRTSLTLGTFGFGMVGFFRSLRAQAPTAETVRLHQGAIQFGTGLVVLGICFMALAGLLTGSRCGSFERESLSGSRGGRWRSRWPSCWRSFSWRDSGHSRHDEDRRADRR